MFFKTLSIMQKSPCWFYIFPNKFTQFVKNIFWQLCTNSRSTNNQQTKPKHAAKLQGYFDKAHLKQRRQIDSTDSTDNNTYCIGMWQTKTNRDSSNSQYFNTIQDTKRVVTIKFRLEDIPGKMLQANRVSWYVLYIQGDKVSNSNTPIDSSYHSGIVYCHLSPNSL